MSLVKQSTKTRKASPLHSAAQVYDHHTLKQLLEDGADPNAVDQDRRTPLHVLLNNGFLGHLNHGSLEICTNLLLEGGADPNAKDSECITPLYLATVNKFTKCARFLLLSGADLALSPYNESGNVALATKLSLTMPDLVREVFDDAVTHKTTDKGESVIKLDWRPILQFKKTKEVDEAQTLHYEPKRHQKETSFLYSLLEGNYSTRKKLLTHPLLRSFLFLKHEKVRRKLWIFYFGVTLFPILYLGFIYYLYFYNCKEKSESTEATTVNSETTTTIDSETTTINSETKTTSKPTESCEINVLISLASYSLTLIVVTWSSIETYMLIRMDVQHLRRWRTWVTGIGLSLMTLSLWPGLQFETLEISFQYPIAALGIFFAWVMFLLQMGSYPKFSVYIEVLVQILLSVLKIVLLFLPLLIGFFMGFALMFDDMDSVFRFIIMMIDVGTADYESIIDRPRDERKSIWYSAMTHTFCVGFIIIIVIVFMNFVLGSSIDNIQKLRHEAKITYTARHVENLFTIDQLDWVIACRLVTPEKLARGELHYEFSPNSPAPQCNLPEDVRTGLIEIIKKRIKKERKKASEHDAIMNGKSEDYSSESFRDLSTTLQKMEKRIKEMTLKLESLQD